MAKQDYSLQLTFHYNSGAKESFLVTESADQTDPYPELKEAIENRLNQQWCSLHTVDETIYINMANIDNVTVKPSLGGSEQDMGFHEAQRVTALTRSSKVL